MDDGVSDRQEPDEAPDSDTGRYHLTNIQVPEPEDDLEDQAGSSPDG